MVFRFVHTADWQLGKRFGGFDGETQALLREARLAVIDQLADLAGGGGAAHVLVAGDVFDDGRASRATLKSAMSRLRKHQSITWHLLPGNHDAHREDGVFARAAAEGVPENVRLHLDAAASEIAAGVFVIAAPLGGRASERDPTAFMDTIATADGTTRIGLAHGSVRGFGSDASAAIRIDPGRSASAGLGYLALGDWHGTLRVDDRCWYSGTPEPDSFTANDKGNALFVSLASATAAPRVEVVPTGHFNWIELAVSITEDEALGTVTKMLADSRTPAERVLLRLALSGSCSVARRRELALAIDDLAPTLRFLSVDSDRLQVRPQSLQHDQFTDPDIARIAIELASETADADQAKSAIGRRALELLIEIDSAASRRQTEAA